MIDSGRFRAVLRELESLFQNRPSDHDAINEAMDKLIRLADEDPDTYMKVLREEGVQLLLPESEVQHVARAQFREGVKLLGLDRELEPTPDNIAAAYHAARLRDRAVRSTKPPAKKTGDPLHDSAVWFPHDRKTLATMLERAHQWRRRVSVVGSYRSQSDAPDVNPLQDGRPTPGPTVIVTSFLNRLLSVDVDNQLYTCEPGRAIWQINADLEANGLAMPNLGGGDFQTVAGAISTATHGSGLDFPDFSMFVQAFELLTLDSDGKAVVRTYRRGDADFNAIIVSMGAMGVVISLTLKVTQAFWLHERRTLMPWSEARKLVDQYVRGQLNVRHFEVLINPYKTSMRGDDIHDAHDKPLSQAAKAEKDHLCIVTRRVAVPRRVEGKRPSLMYLAQRGLGRWAARLGLEMMINAPDTVPARLAESLRGNRVDSYTDLSWHVLKLGLLVEANAAEYGVPAARAAEAAEEILKFAEERCEDGVPSLLALPPKRREFWRTRPMHTSPISLRFVGASDTLLSMAHGRDSCMIEVPMLADAGAEGVEDGSLRDEKFDAYAAGRRKLFVDIFQRLDARIRGPGNRPEVRPHWGLVDPVAQRGSAWVKERWGGWDEWYAAYRRHNPTGTFDCAFTDRLKISIAMTG